MELTWLLPLATLLVTLVLLLLSHDKKRFRLPPGPATVPVLGNLLWVTRSDDTDALRRLHARHGPLLALRMGSRLEVSVADRRLAHAALVERGTAMADRPEFASRDFLGLNSSMIASYNYGPLWRLFRRNLVAEVAHPARLRLFAPAREWVLAELKDKLRRRQEDGAVAGAGAGTIMETFQYVMFYLLVAMCFGELLDEDAVRGIGDALRDLMLYSGTKLSIFVFLPTVTKRLFRGRLQTLLAMRRRLMDMYQPLIDARRERKKLGTASPAQKETTLPHAYVDTLLEIRINDDGGRELSEVEMVALCSEFLTAGADTTASALEWIMAELVKNPAIQDKLHGEINSITSPQQIDGVSEEDVQKMPYLRAVVLEGLRRHPPAHQLVPHAAAEDTELGGYVIPKGTTVNFMVADMGMDEGTWDRPKEFVPERFLAGGNGDGVDMTGTREIKMMPFGAGRRICPGMSVAMLHLEYFVANLVAAFEWRVAEGEEVDVVSEKAEFSVVMKNPLRASLVPRGVV